MSDDIVYAAQSWVTNAQMIQDVHRLGYLHDDDFILDPTYGRGTWWRVWMPTVQAGGYLLPRDRKIDPRWDFRAMWEHDEEFDAVAFDPPYCSVGGRTTTGIGEMHAAYGMDGTPLSPQGVQDDIDAGLSECYRVVRKGGIVLVKMQDYVSSGKLWPGVHHTWNTADRLGFQVIDHLIHIGGPRPQPAHARQVHARRNNSDLLVLRRPRRS